MALLNKEEIVSHSHVDSLVLMNERGGDWLGHIHDWIQRRCRNGERVTWGSEDVLTMPTMTVRDMEYLAAGIAEDAIAEARRDLRSFLESMRTSGLYHDKLFGQPMLVTPVVTDANSELNHNHCIGAYSWMTGGLVYGQGKFTGYGQWEHGCVKCNHAHDLNSN